MTAFPKSKMTTLTLTTMTTEQSYFFFSCIISFFSNLFVWIISFSYICGE